MEVVEKLHNYGPTKVATKCNRCCKNMLIMDWTGLAYTCSIFDTKFKEQAGGPYGIPPMHELKMDIFSMFACECLLEQYPD